MKKIFSTVLVCFTAFAFANNEPIFEETDEDAKISAYRSFAVEEPIFEDDDEQKVNEQDEINYALRPFFQDENDSHRLFHGSYVSWNRFKANFGMEKLFIRFPQKPAMTQTNTTLTAFAYDHTVLYSLTGYYPPIGNISPIVWFNDVLYSLDQYPCSLISHATFQASNGDWVLDYVAHDYVQNLIIKARAIVTPFNAYTLQCVKPNGSRDSFDYFVDSFWIKCECD